MRMRHRNKKRGKYHNETSNENKKENIIIKNDYNNKNAINNQEVIPSEK